MKNMKRIVLLMLCLVLGMVALTSCSAGDPTGNWYLTDIKNNDTGTMADVLEVSELTGIRLLCNITSNRVRITFDGEDLMTFNYRRSGNELIDTADDTVVTYRISGDKLTLIFEDCDMIFTRIN